MATSEAGKIFDTILSIPGMNEVVKIDLKLSRKEVLILNSAIRRGIGGKDEEKQAGLLESVDPNTLEKIGGIGDDCLHKAGLTELSEKLKALNAK